jgi:Cu(I)/Ag(I) efflux system membrane fusion protein
MEIQTKKVFWTSAIATALLAGYAQQPLSAQEPNKDGTKSTMPAMPNMPKAGQHQEHKAEGTLNSIDLAAGRVNITHGPVASASWPGMTMSFKLANPDVATGLKAGQRVAFQFTIESGMDATITQMKPAETKAP